MVVTYQPAGKIERRVKMRKYESLEIACLCQAFSRDALCLDDQHAAHLLVLFATEIVAQERESAGLGGL